MADYEQTPNTPAVHVFVSLHAALKEITKHGIAQTRQNIQDRAIFTRDQLTHMGLEYADYSGNNSSVITCVMLPGYISFEHLARQLKTKGIVVYNGKGVLKDRIFQIGHIGALRKNDTRDAMRQLQDILQQLGQAALVPSLSVLNERVDNVV
jgi:2-aminoethylphosphonate-pyruvate transaminase